MIKALVLPPGFTFYDGKCRCGKPLWRIDTLDGVPFYACADRCGQEPTTPIPPVAIAEDSPISSTIRLPPGLTLFPGTCQCGKQLWQVDHLEGIPIYGCVDHCGQLYPSDPESLKKRKLESERERD